MNLNTKLSFILFVANSVKGGLPALKAVIRTAFFRRAWYSDDHDELERMYKTLNDPWNFETSVYELNRFDLLLREVGKYPHDRVLEVGCGEGLFTSRLAMIARHVVAIDVSPTAVDRARRRCPDPTYVVASLDEFATGEKFDLVICAETLYYIKDVRRAIEKLSNLGRYCLVSYLGRESKRLDPYFERMPSAVIRRFEVGNGVMNRPVNIVIWKPL